MKNNRFSIKKAYLMVVIIIVLLMILQVFLLSLNHRHEARTTTSVYLRQVETILSKNKHQEESLLASLKEEYTVLATAVSYYLDHNEVAISDYSELKKICSLMDIGEIHVFDDEGTIISSSEPRYLGLNFDDGEQISYFKPMLKDRNLTMCQDMTPNSAEGKPMVYAITWNEAKTYMVQVGIEPTRLLEELDAHEMQETVGNIPVNTYMSIVVADKENGEVIGATNDAYDGKRLQDITDIAVSSINGYSFVERCVLQGTYDMSFCAYDATNDYYILVFLDYLFFADRTLEQLLVVFIYLSIAGILVIFVAKKLFKSIEENNQHMQVFESMSEIYYSLHYVDLNNNSVVEYSAKNQVKDNFNEKYKNKADEMMKNIMHATMSDEYLERGLEFSDITTLPERMKDKKVISMELLGKNVGWIRMSFITISEVEGRPQKIIIATQIIDEEKRTAQSLYEKSHIDAMTNCYNRRAYDEDIKTFLEENVDEDFAYATLDINGLKTVNDDLGHEAGDELICGSTDCIRDAFSGYGKVYRIGGDEFAAILSVDSEKMQELCEILQHKLDNWQGELVKSLSISYGYVLSCEVEGKTMTEIANIADTRMYKAKAEYYKKLGIERRRT